MLAPRHLNITLAEPEPGQEVVPRRDRRRSGRDEDVLEAVPRARRRLRRLQGQPRARAHDSQQRRHPAHLGRRRREEGDPDSRRRARVERRLVARQQQRGVSRCTPTTRRHIWIADVATGKSRQLTKTPVLATLVSNFEFTADGKQIAAVLIPDDRVAMPPAPPAPDGPTVKIADSDKNRLRTFPSLMSTTYQRQLLEWHATGQVALIDVAEGRREEGRPAGDGSLGRRRRPTASTCASRR